MKQLELTDRELELIIVGIGAGVISPEYEEDEYYKEVIPLIHKLEDKLGKTLKDVFKERDEMYDGGKE